MTIRATPGQKDGEEHRRVQDHQRPRLFFPFHPDKGTHFPERCIPG
jgi:hypothetical protein